jgi:hypothetical protein
MSSAIAAPAPLKPFAAYHLRVSLLVRNIYTTATDWEVKRFAKFFAWDNEHPKKRYDWTDEQILAGIKRFTPLSRAYPAVAAAADCVVAPPVMISRPAPVPAPDAAAWDKYRTDHASYVAAHDSYMKTTWVTYKADMASWQADMGSYRPKARDSAHKYKKCPCLPAPPIPPSPPTMSEESAAAAAALYLDNFYSEYDIQGLNGYDNMNEWLFDFTGRGRRTTYYRYERDGRTYLYRPCDDDMGFVGELIDEKTLDTKAKDPTEYWGI